MSRLNQFLKTTLNLYGSFNLIIAITIGFAITIVTQKLWQNY